MAQAVTRVTRPLSTPISAPRPSSCCAPPRERDNTLVVLAALTWLLLIAAFVLDRATSLSGAAITLIYAGAYLTGGTLAFKEAVANLFAGAVNVDLLMVTAAIGAATIGAWGEGGVLLALFASSHALEHFALDRTRNAVRALMALTPEHAAVLRDGVEQLVLIEDVLVGERVVVRPGERLPVDGRVTAGLSDVDQATITGESLPVPKAAGDPVFAGTMNGRGVLEVEVTKHASESTLARIVRVVSNAREQQGRTQRFAEAFEGKYAVGVIAFSGLVFLVPWLTLGHGASDAFYRAMTLLVVLSPCALVISTPASTLSALANAARHGILFKGGAHLEAAGSIPIVAFDKTGTLTHGRPTLTDAVSVDPALSDDDLLQLAASVEHFSEHPISLAIAQAARARELPLLDVTGFQARPGAGVSADVGGRRLSVGNLAMLRELGISADVADERARPVLASGQTVVYLTDERRVLGVLAVADTVRPEAAATVARLKRVGVRRVVMITGDNERVAAEIARQVGIDEYRAEVLPEEKMAVIAELRRDGKVAMIGDGVNDAPALATADLGIAMGGAGTDVALETADMVLITDDLDGVAYAIELSRQTNRTIVQNLAFSLGVILLLALAALSVGIPLPLGVIGHEGSTVVVVVNGLRLLAWGRS
jgi:Zn2+/Cd2+-exporting ATPase